MEIAAPPSLPGGEKLTVTCELPATALPITGAPGAVAADTGVTLLDALDAGLVPWALVAITVQLTLMPLLSPDTVNGEFAPLEVSPPQVAVNCVIGDPPVLPGAEKPIVT